MTYFFKKKKTTQIKVFVGEPFMASIDELAIW